MSAPTLSLRGTHVATDDPDIRWIVAAEYEEGGRTLVDLTGARRSRVVRRNAVDVGELRNPETGVLLR